MKLKKYPQILLVGNGLIRGFSNNSLEWSELLKKYSCNSGVPENLENVPYPLQIVLRTQDKVNQVMKENSKEFYGSADGELGTIIRSLLLMNFDDILTTNYSYEIESAAMNISAVNDKMLKNMLRHTKDIRRSESKYLLHTYNEINYDKYEHRIWHIHGEARKPDSMIIGHYYYGNLLYKYKQLIDSRKKTYQFNNSGADFGSWIDAFILGNVYILGFGYDFSEMDMWWLLNRKKREKADKGKVYFYEPNITNKFNAKTKLLEAYDVKVCCCGYNDISNSEYKDFYNDAIKDIGQKIDNNE